MSFHTFILFNLYVINCWQTTWVVAHVRIVQSCKIGPTMIEKNSLRWLLRLCVTKSYFPIPLGNSNFFSEGKRTEGKGHSFLELLTTYKKKFIIAFIIILGGIVQFQANKVTYSIQLYTANRQNVKCLYVCFYNFTFSNYKNYRYCGIIYTLVRTPDNLNYILFYLNRNTEAMIAQW